MGTYENIYEILVRSCVQIKNMGSSLPYAADAESPLKPAELQVLRSQYEKEGEHVGVQTKFNFACGRRNDIQGNGKENEIMQSGYYRIAWEETCMNERADLLIYQLYCKRG